MAYCESFLEQIKQMSLTSETAKKIKLCVDAEVARYLSLEREKLIAENNKIGTIFNTTPEAGLNEQKKINTARIQEIDSTLASLTHATDAPHVDVTAMIPELAAYFAETSLKHLTITLADAPPAIKEHSAELCLHVLAKASTDKRKQELQSLDDKDLADLLENATNKYDLTPDAELKKSYKALVQDGVNELIRRKCETRQTLGTEAFGTLISSISASLPDVKGSTMLDDLNLDEIQTHVSTAMQKCTGSPALDWKHAQATEVAEKLHGLYEKLRVGQEDRREYVQKCMDHLIKDLFWARNIHEMELFPDAGKIYTMAQDMHFIERFIDKQKIVRIPTDSERSHPYIRKELKLIAEEGEAVKSENIQSVLADLYSENQTLIERTPTFISTVDKRNMQHTVNEIKNTYNYTINNKYPEWLTDTETILKKRTLRPEEWLDFLNKAKDSRPNLIKQFESFRYTLKANQYAALSEKIDNKYCKKLYNQVRTKDKENERTKITEKGLVATAKQKSGMSDDLAERLIVAIHKCHEHRKYEDLFPFTDQKYKTAIDEQKKVNDIYQLFLKYLAEPKISNDKSTVPPIITMSYIAYNLNELTEDNKKKINEILRKTDTNPETHCIAFINFSPFKHAASEQFISGSSLEEIEKELENLQSPYLQTYQTFLAGHPSTLNTTDLNKEDEILIRKLIDLYDFNEKLGANKGKAKDVLSALGSAFLCVKTEIREALKIDKLKENITQAYEIIKDLDSNSEEFKSVADHIGRAKKISESETQRKNAKEALKSALASDDRVKDIKAVFESEYKNNPGITKTLDQTPEEQEKMLSEIKRMATDFDRLMGRVERGEAVLTDAERKACFAIVHAIAEQYAEQYKGSFKDAEFKLSHKTEFKRGDNIIYISGKPHKIKLPEDFPEIFHLPYSLNKSPGSDGLDLSFGGSRGAHAPTKGFNAEYTTDKQGKKRFFTNFRTLGVGTYGTVKQVQDLVTGLNSALKKGYVPTGDAQDTFTEKSRQDNRTRDVTSREDKLVFVERDVLAALARAENENQDIAPALYLKTDKTRPEGGIFGKAQPEQYFLKQELGKGQTYADTARNEVAGLRNDSLAYHDPVSRHNEDPLTTLDDMLNLSTAIIAGVKKFSDKGFSHNDIKPENFMYKRKPDGTYDVTFIDWATGGFQLGYKGNKTDLTEIYHSVFGEDKTLSGPPSLLDKKISDSRGRYVTIDENKNIVYGIDPHLEIMGGMFNCTLPYIAPCFLKEEQSDKFTQEDKNTTVLQHDFAAQDNWALTAMTFGICNKAAWFEYVNKGRTLEHYVIPGVIEIVTTPERRLDIIDPEKFEQMFGVPGNNDVMYIPSNAREGEPLHLYRRLSAMAPEESDSILHAVSDAVASGTGLDKNELLELVKQAKKIVEAKQPPEVNAQKEQERIALEANKKTLAEVLKDDFQDISTRTRHFISLFTLSNLADETQQPDVASAFERAYNNTTFDERKGALIACIKANQENMLLELLGKESKSEELKQLIRTQGLLHYTLQEGMTTAAEKLIEIYDDHAMDLINNQNMNTNARAYINWAGSALEIPIRRNDTNQFDLLLKNLNPAPDKASLLLKNALHSTALFANTEFFKKLRGKYQFSPDEILKNDSPSPYHLFLRDERAYSDNDNTQVLPVTWFRANPSDAKAFLLSAPNPLLIAAQYNNGTGFELLLKVAEDSGLSLGEWKALFAAKDSDGKKLANYFLERGDTDQLVKFVKKVQSFTLPSADKTALLKEILFNHEPANPIKNYLENPSVSQTKAIELLDGLRQAIGADEKENIEAKNLYASLLTNNSQWLINQANDPVNHKELDALLMKSGLNRGHLRVLLEDLSRKSADVAQKFYSGLQSSIQEPEISLAERQNYDLAINDVLRRTVSLGGVLDEVIELRHREHALDQAEVKALKDRIDELNSRLIVSEETLGLAQKDSLSLQQQLNSTIETNQEERNRLIHELGLKNEEIRSVKQALAENQSILTSIQSELNQQKENHALQESALQDKISQLDVKNELLTGQVTSLEGNNQTVIRENQDLYKNLLALRNELSTVQTSLAKSRSLQQQYETNANTASKEVKELTSKINKINSELETARAEGRKISSEKTDKLAKKTTELTALQEKFGQSQTELTTHQETIQKLKSELIELQNFKQKISEQLENSGMEKENLTKQFNNAQQALNHSTSQLQDLQNANKNLVMDNEKLASAITSAQEKHNRLIWENSELKSSLEQLTTKLASTNETLDQRETEVSTLKSNVSALQNNLTSIQNESTDLKNQLDSITTTNESERKQLVDKLKINETDLNTLNNMLKENQTNLENKQNELNKLLDNFDSLKSAKEALEKELTNTNTINLELTKELDAAKKTITSSQAKADGLQTTISKLEVENEILTNEIANIKDSNQTLITENQDLKTNLSDLQKNMASVESSLAESLLLQKQSLDNANTTTEQVNELTGKITRIQSELEMEKAKGQQISTEKTAELLQKAAELDELQKQYDQSQAELTAHQKAIHKLKEGLTNLNGLHDQLTEQLDTAAVDKKILMSELLIAKQQLDESNNKFLELQNTNATLADLNETIKDEIKTAQDINKHLIQENSDFKSRVEQLTTELATTNETLAQRETEVSNLNTKVDALNNSLASAQKESSELKEKLNSTASENESERKNLVEKLETNEATLAALEKLLETNQTQLEKGQTALSELKHEFDLLQITKETLDSELAAKDATNTELTKKLDETEKIIALSGDKTGTLQETISTLEVENKILTNEVAYLKAGNQTIITENQDLKAGLRALDHELAAVKATLSQSHMEQTLLESKANDATERATVLSAELEQLNRELKTAKTDHKQLEIKQAAIDARTKEIRKLQAEARQNQAASKKLQKTINKQNDQLAHLTTVEKTLTQQLEYTKGEKTKLQEQLSNATKQIEQFTLEANQLQNANQKLVKRNETLENEIKAAQDKNKQLIQENNDLKSNIKQLTTELTSKIENLAESVAKVSTLNSTIAALNKKLESTTAKNTSEREQLVEQLNTLNDLLEENKRQLNDEQKKLNVLQQEFHSLQTTKNDLDNELAGKGIKNEKLTKQLDEAEKTIASSKTTAGNLQTRISTLEKSNEQLTAQVTSLTTQNQELMESAREKDQLIHTQEETINRITAEMLALKKQLEEKPTDFTLNTAEALLARIATLEAELKARPPAPPVTPRDKNTPPPGTGAVPPAASVSLVPTQSSKYRNLASNSGKTGKWRKIHGAQPLDEKSKIAVTITNFTAYELTEKHLALLADPEKGLDLTSTAGLKYKFSRVGEEARAELRNDQIPEDLSLTEEQEKLAVTLVNMATNILSKHPSIKVDTDNPLIAEFYQQYFDYLDTQEDNFTIKRIPGKPIRPATPEEKKTATNMLADFQKKHLAGTVIKDHDWFKNHKKEVELARKTTTTEMLDAGKENGSGEHLENEANKDNPFKI